KLAGLLRERVSPLAFVGDVRLRGLMAGIELVQDKKSRKAFPAPRRAGWSACLKARDLGVWIRPLGDVVVLMPPLNILDKALELLVEAVRHGILSLGQA